MTAWEANVILAALPFSVVCRNVYLGSLTLRTAVISLSMSYKHFLVNNNDGKF